MYRTITKEQVKTFLGPFIPCFILPPTNYTLHIAHLLQQCHNSKNVIFQEKILKVLNCYNFLRVQRWHNCYPAASFAHCVMTLYLLKVHLQKFLSIPITQKCQILSCDTCCKWAMYCLRHVSDTFCYLEHGIF